MADHLTREDRDLQFELAVHAAYKDEELIQAGGILPTVGLVILGCAIGSAGGWWWLLAAPMLTLGAVFAWVTIIDSTRTRCRAEAAAYVAAGRRLPRRLRRWA